MKTEGQQMSSERASNSLGSNNKGLAKVSHALEWGTRHEQHLLLGTHRTHLLLLQTNVSNLGSWGVSFGSSLSSRQTCSL
jgi:hypothetical protein